MVTEVAHRRVILVCGAQLGKTDLILDLIGHRLAQKPAPTLYVGPTLQFVTEQFEPRIMALLDEAPTLMAKVARGKRMTKTRKVVAGVPLRLAHAGSSPALKSDPAALALVDEFDEMLANVKGQGDPLGLVEARGDAFADFCCVVTSTPRRGIVDVEKDEASGLEFWAVADPQDVRESPIWSLWQQGTRHHWCWPCPHCGEYFVPRFDRMRWQEGASPVEAARKAFLECPHCGGVIEEKHKAKMNACGRYVAPGQKIDRDGNITGKPSDDVTAASYWVSGLCSPFKTFGDRVQTYLAATERRDNDGIQTAINAGFGELYTPGGADLKEWQQVAQRRGLHRFGELPVEVVRITMAVDVQKRSLFYSIRGWGARASSWQIDSGELTGLTDEPEVWGDLADLITQTYDGLPISLVLIDSGFRVNKPDQGSDNVVYEFCRRFPRNTRPTKGSSTAMSAPVMKGKAKLTVPGWQGPVTLELIRLDTDFWKSRLHDRLSWPEGQPGGFTLSADATDDYCKQLVSEVRTVTPSGKPLWVRIGRNNHWLDCFDPQTELLTKDGWLPVRSAVTSAAEFATVNLATDQIEYQQATRGIARWYSGEMVKISGRRIDVLVTPNHRMVVNRIQPCKRELNKVVLARDLDIWDRIKLTAKWTETELDWVSETRTRAAHLRRADNASLISRVPYDGPVYCVSVPNGTLVARRNGLPFIAGNCEAMQEAAGHLLNVQRIPLGLVREMAERAEDDERAMPPPNGARGRMLGFAARLNGR